MLITTLEAKQAHPFASKIPLNVWQRFFEKGFDDDKIPAADINLNQISRDNLPVDDDEALIALMVRYPDEQPADIISAARRILHMHPIGVLSISANMGRIDMLNLLAEQATNELPLPALIKSRGYLVFREAVADGQLDILNWLGQKAPDTILEIIKKDYYQVFRNAAKNGQLDILTWMATQAPHARHDMIKAWNHEAFRMAAENGHLEILTWLAAQAPAELPAMIEDWDYDAFRNAARQGHLNICQWLLQHPTCLAYAEQHVAEYGEQVVNPFIRDTLATLHRERDQALADHPNGVFDVTDIERQNSCFYMLRNLIRRNDPALQDEILFLLDIPSVKALVHTAVTPNEHNELLRLAIASNNQDAAACLMAIPAVRLLAEQNNFYRDENRGQLDLRALAQDRESSMRALTTGEQQRIADAIKRYQPMIKAAGLENLIEALKDKLAKRYEKHPAKITLQHKELALPITWEAFKAMPLDAAAQESALLAYRKDKNHTALRYLSKPNHWMAGNASYVNVNPENTQERWSTYDGYLSEIALFWLAAQDKQMPATDGHTLKGRLDHFIDELAHIGRAHNWDATRRNARGELEEYDDLQGDKPSCFSGVKRRLMQSVVGHPLLKVLRRDDLNAELRDFVREHFAKHLTPDNIELIKETLDYYAFELEITDDAGTQLLKSMDISPDLQKQFINHLSEKYGQQFNSEPQFQQFIHDEFKLEENKEKGNTYAHVFKFNGLANLSELVKKYQASTVVDGAAKGSGKYGLFTPATEQASKDDVVSADALKQTKK